MRYESLKYSFVIGKTRVLFKRLILLPALNVRFTPFKRGERVISNVRNGLKLNLLKVRDFIVLMSNLINKNREVLYLSKLLTSNIRKIYMRYI